MVPSCNQAGSCQDLQTPFRWYHQALSLDFPAGSWPPRHHCRDRWNADRSGCQSPFLPKLWSRLTVGDLTLTDSLVQDRPSHHCQAPSPGNKECCNKTIKSYTLELHMYNIASLGKNSSVQTKQCRVPQHGFDTSTKKSTWRCFGKVEEFFYKERNNISHRDHHHRHHHSFCTKCNIMMRATYKTAVRVAYY